MRSRTQARAILRLTAPTRSSSSNPSTTTSANPNNSTTTTTTTKDKKNGRSRSSLRPRPRSNSNSNPSLSSNFYPRSISSRSSSSSSSNLYSSSSSPSSLSAAASPPPTALPQLVWQSFFSAGRPLLELDALPRRLNNKNILSQDYHSNLPHWRTKASRISSSRFSSLLDSLSNASNSSSPTKPSAGRIVPSSSTTPSSTSSSSPVVRSASRQLHSEQAQERDRKRAISLAIERGEDPTLASSLGSESDLVVLGEPNGPRPEWSRGVATYLAEHTRAYQPPPAPVPIPKGSLKYDNRLKPKSTVYLTDDDPSLMLSHALIQSTLPQALQWDRIESLMDSAAKNDKSLERNGINLKAIRQFLNDKSLGYQAGEEVEGMGMELEAEGKIMSFDQLTKEAEANGWILLAGNEMRLLDDHDGKGGVGMDSVKRKRKTKMRKHKYRKLRKRQRSERQRMKK